MTRQVVYEGQVITYEVERKKVRNVNFRLKSDLTLWVSAPETLSEAELDEMVLSKAEWILAGLARLASRSETRLTNCYRDGGQVAYLGELLPLEVHAEGEAGWQFGEQGLELSGCKDEAAIRAQVERFYQEMCIIAFEGLNEWVYETYFAKEQLEKAKVVAKRLSASWGRCHVRKGLIVLNRQLIKASPECILSVLIHEYVHFLHPNHSKDFYACLHRLLPQYDALTRQLTEQVSCRPED